MPGKDSLALAKVTAFDLCFDAWYQARNHIALVLSRFLRASLLFS